MSLRFVAIVTLVGVLGAAGSAAGGAASSPATILDRTWSCPVVGSGGARTLVILGVGPDYGTPTSASASLNLWDELAPRKPRILIATELGLVVSRRCAAAKPVAFGRGGLSGPVVGITNRYDCRTPAKVLIRLRARVANVGPWRRSRDDAVGLLTAVSRAEIVVHAPRGRRIAYGSIAGAKLEMQGSSTCVRS